MTEISKLVPPMSTPTTCAKPVSWPMKLAAMTPPAGPELTMFTARWRASRIVIDPPLACMIRTSSSRPYSRASLAERLSR